MDTLAFDAMAFAKVFHANQFNKYTKAPYFEHLAQVVGIVSSVAHLHPNMSVSLAVAWLHDSREDHGVSHEVLQRRFGEDVAIGVQWISDLDVGNRAFRKAASRARLAQAPAWVQDIKVADIFVNTASIGEQDPGFAPVYRQEKKLQLAVLTLAHPGLMRIALAQLAPA